MKKENGTLDFASRKKYNQVIIAGILAKGCEAMTDKFTLTDDIQKTYQDHQKENTLRHVEAVAQTALWLADIYNLDADKVRTAALLHDISAIITPGEMYKLAADRGMKIYIAEEKYPFLLHQRISEIFAAEYFDIHDPAILSAIGCHTTLKKKAGMYDKVIFLADKISWDQKGTPPYYELLKRKAAESLEEACRFYIQYQFDNNLLLMPHPWLLEAYEELSKDYPHKK